MYKILIVEDALCSGRWNMALQKRTAGIAFEKVEL